MEVQPCVAGLPQTILLRAPAMSTSPCNQVCRLNEKLPRTPTSQALTSGDGLRNLWVFLRRDLLAQVYEQMTLSQMKIKRIHVC